MSQTYDPEMPGLEEAPRRRLHYKPASDTGGRDAYTAARRHSGVVRMLKFVLPALALAGVAVFWGTARFVPGEYVDAVSIAGIDVESNSVVMKAPHISGFEGTRRAYDVKAEDAVQSLDDPKVITFNTITATLGMDASGTATVTAPVGVFDGNVNKLSFSKGVHIVTSEAQEARFTNALVDLDAGSLVTDQPLEFTSGIASLSANAVTVLERGKRVSFTGGVSISYRPGGNLMTTPQKAATTP